MITPNWVRGDPHVHIGAEIQVKLHRVIQTRGDAKAKCETIVRSRRGHRLADISQLADVAAAVICTMDRVEIRIFLDRLDPPSGRLRVTPDTAGAQSPAIGQAMRFVGWLGLLKALDEVTRASSSSADEGG